MTTKVKLLFADTTIEPGGLLRCCFKTIHDFVGPRSELAAPPELVISCEIEGPDSQNIILKDGVWHWNHE